ncbi:unnamed protein product, partial [Mesorhabditis belari]|uniref:Uncharacterized protein n=1 Tax=Mesorhabditis belari TaxID=2138241 RepID=A0AAF3FBF4_9BILA
MQLSIFILISMLSILVDGCAPDLRTTREPRTTRKHTTRGTTQPPAQFATRGTANLEIIPTVIFSYPGTVGSLQKWGKHHRIKRQVTDTTTTTTTTIDPITETTDSSTTSRPVEPVTGQPDNQQEALAEITDALKANLTNALLKHKLDANVKSVGFTFTPDLPIAATQGDFCDTAKTKIWNLTSEYIFCGSDPFFAGGNIVLDLDASIDKLKFEDVFREMLFDLDGKLFDIFETPTFQFA